MHLARAIEAANAASTIARLLGADSCIRTRLDHVEDPTTEPQPFANDVHWGLEAALRVCLETTVGCLEHLADDDRKRA